MELAKLRYFYRAAELLNITRAAEEIHIAQPALTQAIRSLESELNVKLFEKRGRNVYLTEFGVYLKEKLSVIFPQIDDIPKEINALKKQKSNTVRLNILAASNFVINAIVEYRKKHPQVIIDLEQNEFKSGCDLSIYTDGLTGTADKKSKKREIKEEQIFLAVPSDSVYAAKNEIELASVKDEKFVMLSGSRLFRKICDNLCLKVGFTPKAMFESDSPNAVQNVISAGTGIAFWPSYTWGKIKNDKVKLLTVKDVACKRKIIVELNERSVSSKYAEDFYEFLLKKMPDNG